jgi:hypothetical protein
MARALLWSRCMNSLPYDALPIATSTLVVDVGSLFGGLVLGVLLAAAVIVHDARRERRRVPRESPRGLRSTLAGTRVTPRLASDAR